MLKRGSLILKSRDPTRAVGVAQLLNSLVRDHVALRDHFHFSDSEVIPKLVQCRHEGGSVARIAVVRRRCELRSDYASRRRRIRDARHADPPSPSPTPPARGALAQRLAFCVAHHTWRHLAQPINMTRLVNLEFDLLATVDRRRGGDRPASTGRSGPNARPV